MKQLEPTKDDHETPQLDQTGTETLVALLTSKTKTEASEKLGIDRRTIYDRIAKYGLDKIIADIPNKALQTLQLGSVFAAETLVNMSQSAPSDIKFEAAKEVLNRVGVGQGTPAAQINMNMGLLIQNYKDDKAT